MGRPRELAFRWQAEPTVCVGHEGPHLSCHPTEVRAWGWPQVRPSASQGPVSHLGSMSCPAPITPAQSPSWTLARAPPLHHMESDTEGALAMWGLLQRGPSRARKLPLQAERASSCPLCEAGQSAPNHSPEVGILLRPVSLRDAVSSVRLLC